jgi:hypothetical protein
LDPIPDLHPKMTEEGIREESCFAAKPTCDEITSVNDNASKNNENRWQITSVDEGLLSLT